jgi:hypothetical protein
MDRDRAYDDTVAELEAAGQVETYTDDDGGRAPDRRR